MPLKPKLGFILTCIFLDALGIGLIIPVLPRLIGVLTHSRDLQTFWYGLIMLSYGVMQFISAPLLGALSDRIGRRPVLLGGILGLGAMFAVPALSSSLPLILGSRLLGGLLSANMAVAQAYIADITVGFQRAAGFGKIGAVFGIGFVLGPALGGVLGQSDPRLPFMVAGGICLLNFLYGAFVLPESLKNPSRAPLSFRSNNPLSAIAALMRQRDNLPLVLVLALTSLANGLLQSTWALYTEFRYDFTPLLIGLSVFALGLSISFVQGFALGRWLLLFRARSLVITVLTVGALCMLGIGLAPWGLLACLLCCLYAVSGAVGPILTGSISRRAPVQEQGCTIGAVSSLNSLTGALAPALGTPLLWLTARNTQSVWSGLPYLVSALLMVLALWILCRSGNPIFGLSDEDPSEQAAPGPSDPVCR